MTAAPTYAFVFGTHPDLSAAELEAVVALPVKHHGQIGFVRAAIDPPDLMNRLGGTIKIVELVGQFSEDSVSDWLIDQINPDSKFHFGFSVYALDPGINVKRAGKTLQALGLKLKHVLKTNGFSARYVASKEPVLSSVIVHKERLLKNGVDIVVLKDSAAVQFGKTVAVQPFQAFSKRDYGRPQRDFRSGMLPPKLARMMVNLATPTVDSTILDPFCGSGTVLQEAWLLGYHHLIGTDSAQKAIRDSQTNLDWLGATGVQLQVSGVQNLLEHKHLEPQSIDRIIFEGYLGPPKPDHHTIKQVITELTHLYSQAFPVLQRALKPHGRIVAALPFWHSSSGTHYLPIEKMTTAAGLTSVEASLFYRRPQSVVGRQIVVLERLD